MAIRISGPAFTSSCGRGIAAKSSNSGSQKIVRIASTGSLPERREHEPARDHRRQHRQHRRERGPEPRGLRGGVSSFQPSWPSPPVGRVQASATPPCHGRRPSSGRSPRSSARRRARIAASAPSFRAAKRSADLHQLVQVLADHDHRRPLGGQVEQRLPDRGGGRGIDAPGRLVDHQNTRGRCRTSRPMTNFCRLPPDSARAAVSGPGVRTSKASMIRLGEAARAAPVDESARAPGPRARRR